MAHEVDRQPLLVTAHFRGEDREDQQEHAEHGHRDDDLEQGVAGVAALHHSDDPPVSARATMTLASCLPFHRIVRITFFTPALTVVTPMIALYGFSGSRSVTSLLNVRGAASSVAKSFRRQYSDSFDSAWYARIVSLACCSRRLRSTKTASDVVMTIVRISIPTSTSTSVKPRARIRGF